MLASEPPDPRKQRAAPKRSGGRLAGAVVGCYAAAMVLVELGREHPDIACVWCVALVMGGVLVMTGW